MINEEKSFYRHYSYGIMIFLLTMTVTLFFLSQAQDHQTTSLARIVSPGGSFSTGAKKDVLRAVAKEPVVTVPAEHKKYLEKIIESCAPHEEFIIAQSGDFTGHFKLYANLIKLGMHAYFDRINKEEGGIAGKPIRFIAVHDYGEPQIAAYNVRRLKEACGIELFMGNMGTRCITTVLPDADAGKVALLFPWGGSDELRNPVHKMIINGLGYMLPQLEALVDYARLTLKKDKIALFYADSDFSVQLVNQTNQLLERVGSKPVAVASYNRFTFDVVRSSMALIEADPKVVICLATSMPTVKLVRNFFRNGLYGADFMGIDSTAFVKDILRDTVNRYHFSSAVPDARNDERPLTVQFRADYARIAPEEEPTELALAYYLSAAIVVDACKQVTARGEPLSKEQIIAQIEKMEQRDIGGFSITFDPELRHAFGKEAFIIVR